MGINMLKLFKLSTKKIITVVALSTFLSACSNDDDKKTTVVTDTIPEIVLSADGVGPLNASTSFNMHQMTVAFSDYSVEEVINFQQSAPYPVVRISKNGNSLITVNPDPSRQNIYSIIIEDNKVKNSLGHHLGSVYNDVYTYGQTEKCQAGIQDMSGKVLCYAPKTPNILYVFNGKWNGADGKIPPAEILQDWILESIVWRPKT